MKTESAQQESSNQRRFAVCLVADGKTLVLISIHCFGLFISNKHYCFANSLCFGLWLST